MFFKIFIFNIYYNCSKFNKYKFNLLIHFVNCQEPLHMDLMDRNVVCNNGRCIDCKILKWGTLHITVLQEVGNTARNNYVPGVCLATPWQHRVVLQHRLRYQHRIYHRVLLQGRVLTLIKYCFWKYYIYYF